MFILVADLKTKNKNKKVECGKSSYFVTFGRGMSAAVYMLFLLLFMTANLMPQAKTKTKICLSL